MSNTFTSTGNFNDNSCMSYFLLILWLMLWKDKYFLVLGSIPIVSESIMILSAFTCFFTASTTSGNCSVTFSSLLVNSIILLLNLCICNRKPSYLYSAAAGVPNVSHLSCTVFA